MELYLNYMYSNSKSLIPIFALNIIQPKLYKILIYHENFIKSSNYSKNFEIQISLNKNTMILQNLCLADKLSKTLMGIFLKTNIYFLLTFFCKITKFTLNKFWKSWNNCTIKLALEDLNRNQNNIEINLCLNFVYYFQWMLVKYFQIKIKMLNKLVYDC